MRILTLALGLTVSLCATAVTAQTPQRVAVIVGANVPSPGRKALRFSHRDAQSVAEVLTTLGGFSEDKVHVLLDPNPGAVLRLIDSELRTARAAEAETVFVFYYSGHADAAALYPGGKPLYLSKLRKRLDSQAAAVRIGVIDACRGGGWTGTKGLTEEKAFDVQLPLTLNNRGSVLIASSSGLENAHESEAIKGSFFTHHWTAGLRGAADRNQDGQITLAEAFAYARALTIRDTALHTTTPQHPSFQFNLRGRHDLTLSRPGAPNGRDQTALLTFTQTAGPTQLIDLESGLVLLEVPRGKRRLKLAIPPGRYVLRRRSGKKAWARVIAIDAAQPVYVHDKSLGVVRPGSLMAKGMGPVADASDATRIAYAQTAFTRPAGTMNWSTYMLGYHTFDYGLNEYVQVGIGVLLPIAVVGVAPHVKASFSPTEWLHLGAHITGGVFAVYTADFQLAFAGGGPIATFGNRDHFFSLHAPVYWVGRREDRYWTVGSDESHADTDQMAVFLPNVGGSWRVANRVRLNLEAASILTSQWSGRQNGRTWVVNYGARIFGDNVYGDVGFTLPLFAEAMGILEYVPMGLPWVAFGYTW